MADRPVRLQLSRRKGFNLQLLSQATNGLPAVKVARPSKWGNPFTIDAYLDAGYKGDARREVVNAFRIWMTGSDCWAAGQNTPPRPTDLSELRGKNLACFCKAGLACHADVLLALANAPLNPERGGTT